MTPRAHVNLVRCNNIDVTGTLEKTMSILSTLFGKKSPVANQKISVITNHWQQKVKGFDSSSVTESKTKSARLAEDAASSLLLKAQQMDQEGKTSQAHIAWLSAIAELERELNENPINSFSLYNLGIAYQAVKEPQKAIDSLLASLICEPTAPAVYRSLGYLYEELIFLQEAIENFEIAVLQAESCSPHNLVKSDSNPIETHMRLNFCLERAGRWSVAVTSWRRLMEKDSEHPFHRVALSFALMMQDPHGNADEAMEKARYAIQIDRDGKFGVKGQAEEFIRQVQSFKNGGSFMWRNNDGKIVAVQQK